MLLLLALFCSACATGRPAHPVDNRPFDFGRDTFSYANELVWDYSWDEEGRWRGRPRHPPPDYTHHCFVVARTAMQFHRAAAFDPSLPRLDEEGYRDRIREVLRIGTRGRAGVRVTIPGFTGLREFSLVHGELLKKECGGAWNSYLQRGHWRMVLPFGRGHQADTAGQLRRLTSSGTPAVVHIVCFPSLRINHALLVYGAMEEPGEIRFLTYDPNDPWAPAVLTFDVATRTFRYPATDYFPGGEVDIYQIYHSWLY